MKLTIRFNQSEEAGAEKSIVTSTGNYIITCTLRLSVNERLIWRRQAWSHDLLLYPAMQG